MDEQLDEVRLLLAHRRQQRGQEAPTLGRRFPDTPEAPSPDDEGQPQVMDLEAWAAQA